MKPLDVTLNVTAHVTPESSARVQDDPIARAWLRAYEAADPAHRWEPAHVDERLAAAMQLCAQIAGGVAPRGAGGNWPAIVRQYALLWQGDAVLDFNFPPDEDEPPPRRITAREVTEMEDAIEWPGRYIIGHYPQRQVLNLWLRCKASRRSFRKALKQGGHTEGTAKRRRWQASLLIAAGLIRDRVPAPAPTEVHPFQAPEPEAPRPAAAAPAIDLAGFWSEVEIVIALTDPEQLDAAVDALIVAQVHREYAGAKRGARTLNAMRHRVLILREEVAKCYRT